MKTVILESNEFGVEVFHYQTKREAEAGLKRLVKSAKAHEKKDGIQRKVYLR